MSTPRARSASFLSLPSTCRPRRARQLTERLALLDSARASNRRRRARATATRDALPTSPPRVVHASPVMLARLASSSSASASRGGARAPARSRVASARASSLARASTSKSSSSKSSSTPRAIVAPRTPCAPRTPSRFLRRAPSSSSSSSSARRRPRAFGDDQNGSLLDDLDADARCPVPIDQRPSSQLREIQESALLGWGGLELKWYLFRLGLLGTFFYFVIAYPIAVYSYDPATQPVEAIICALVGASATRSRRVQNPLDRSFRRPEPTASGEETFFTRPSVSTFDRITFQPTRSTFQKPNRPAKNSSLPPSLRRLADRDRRVRAADLHQLELRPRPSPERDGGVRRDRVVRRADVREGPRDARAGSAVGCVWFSFGFP